jgi:uncharacterized protein with ParB-like and HNH nuclease domain
MNTKLRRELQWIIGTILSTLIIGLLIFGDRLFNGRALDLQLHDTYFIFPKILLLAAIFIFLLLGTYLNRVIYNNANNKVANIVLAIFLALILFKLKKYWDWIYGYVKDSGYYMSDERSQTEKISEFTMTHWILLVIMLMTIVTLITAGYKIIKPKKVP